MMPMTDGAVPHQLLEVAKKVDARLESVLHQQLTHWERIDPRLCEAIAELQRMTTSGGKRLRAAFCYWAWRGVASMGDGRTAADPDRIEPDDELVIDVGAAFEFLQVFALIHDDIMDNSATRRGATTVHVTNAERLNANGWQGEARRFGEGVAILVGDLGHVYADQLTGPINQSARRIWDELRIELNLGQYLDMRAAAAGEVDHVTAQQVATFKTALYTIVRPLQLGASLPGPADPMLLDLLDRFGRPLGRAFQLRDDALGLTGDENWLGKPVGDDLREGKPTEILSYGIDKADAAQRMVLADVGRRDLSGDDVGRIIDVLRETGALRHNEQLIGRLLDETNQALASLPFDLTTLEALGALANYVAVRNR
jgi:geranylgeranyl diphosphate synthase type I